MLHHTQHAAKDRNASLFEKTFNSVELPVCEPANIDAVFGRLLPDVVL